MPRLAESLQSSLTAGGFHVRLVPVPQDAFFASYLSNPASSQRDAWDAAAPRYIPDWFGNNGRVFLQTGFTYPGNGSQRLRRLLQPGHKLDHQQSARSRERQRCRRPVGAGSAPDHKRRGNRPSGLPDVADLPLLGSTRLQFLVGQLQLRPDESVVVFVTNHRELRSPPRVVPGSRRSPTPKPLPGGLRPRRHVGAPPR